jgi:HSP20 family protein
MSETPAASAVGTTSQEVHDMTIVRRTSPLGELVSLRQAMDRLFEDSFVRPRGWGLAAEMGGTLPLDVTSTLDALLVEAALPGIRPEDVDVTVEDGTLTIRAESNEEHEEKQGEAIIKEIRRGSMSRTVTLPSGLDVDKASATFEHGVLRLTFPRSEAVKPRQIRISPTIDGQSANGSNGTAVEAGDDQRS